MNTLRVYDPLADAGIDQLFRGFFTPVRAPRDTAAAIKIDVTEKADAYVVHAEIPGVKKEDIQVTIEGDQVTNAYCAASATTAPCTAVSYCWSSSTKRRARPSTKAACSS